MRSRKAQSSIEIMMVITVIFTVFLLLHIFVITPAMEETINRKLVFAANTECEKIANTINMVSYSGSGTYANFSLPTLLDNKRDYTITLFRNYVRVSWDTGSRVCHTTTRQVLRALNESRPDLVPFAYLLKENCMYDKLKDFNVSVFCNQNYENACPSISDPCVNKTPTQRLTEHTAFIQEIYNFTLVFADEPHFSSSEMDTIESHAYYGGYSFLSEHLVDLVQNASLFDNTITYNMRDENTGNAEISIITTDSLLNFTTSDDFVPDEYPYLNGSLETIGTFPDDKVGVAAWEYGDGRVYYFSDFDSSLTSQDGDEFRQKVSDSVNTTLIYLGSLLRTPFTLSEIFYSVYNDNDKIYITGWSQ